MDTPRTTTPRLERSDRRPLVVTLVVVGWLVLCGFGAARAIVVLGHAASTTYFGVHDPMDRMALELPELVSDEAHRRLTMRRALADLDRRLAGPLLGLALLGGFSAIRLLRRRPWSRAWLLCVGLLSIALSAYHLYTALSITTLEPVAAIDLPEAQEMLPAFYAVAGINLALQSLPLVLVMSLLRHPAVGRYVRESRVAMP